MNTTNRHVRTRAFAQGAMVVLLVLLVVTTAGAQLQPPPAPWRGAGSTPCVGSDGGIYKCAPAAQTIAVRAGHLFDSKNGTMLTKQVIVLSGEKITDVGPEGQVKIPAGAQVIDLSQATVLPGLIDGHTQMFDARIPNVTPEKELIISISNVQDQLRTDTLDAL